MNGAAPTTLLGVRLRSRVLDSAVHFVFAFWVIAGELRSAVAEIMCSSFLKNTCLATRKGSCLFGSRKHFEEVR